MSTAVTNDHEIAAALEAATALMTAGAPELAAQGLESLVARQRDAFVAWLVLGRARELNGQAQASLAAYFQAITRAQQMGVWLNQESTPPALLGTVVHAIERVRTGRKELLRGSYDSVRQAYGAQELKRVDRAVSVYLKETEAVPPSEHQKPRLFFFPDLPPGPYHDPKLQPWLKTLTDGFEAIREDAVRVLAEDGHFENFIRFRENVPIENYLAGNKPAWEAFFFWRHGRRFDDHHARCPDTSRILESIELCRIDNESPEILFSVMTPGTEILAHHGVTNVRSVMHLPLVIPEGAFLMVHGGGEHHWKAGEPVLFDDTYLHSAKNPSPNTRVVLLMDCWNPHLTAPEKQALKLVLETISGFRRAAEQYDDDDR
ncbi:aspartyl/asparaginyl beta-hydroxylase domain-containing protein [Ramlibacter sp. PS4R-6]|uniref:aspartyl/asparaginyl beta-hydroxylase domain-containing protein n=1 Tax=Ramlibacter sp. PS4R-6 TaxID=3133438 RepID=UPI0030A26A7E